ncbi:MAG: NAD-dependent epimerase/dehydratase family protein [Chloroflexi bacterium OLB13]|nr:MAG: NAD-dependent epimerase/dehydratase family protein [Chloroflexi bacterium OLB13]
MIFVTGAAGFVGRHLVERLLEAGYPVRVLVSPRKANALPKWASHPNVEIVVGVLSDEETLYRALIGVHVVFHLASAQWWGRRRNLERVELVGIRYLAAAARAARVGRIIVLSHLGASPSSGYTLLNVKGQVEEAVKASGLAYTIVRAGLIYGPDDAFINHIAMMLSTNPVFFLMPGNGEVVLHPIHVDDVVSVLMAALERVDTVDLATEVGGAEYTTLLDLIRTIMRVTGMRRLIIPTPPYLLRLWARFAAAVWRRSLLTPQWLDLLATNHTARIANAFDVFGVRPRRLEDSLVGYLPNKHYLLRALAYVLRARPREA